MNRELTVDIVATQKYKIFIFLIYDKLMTFVFISIIKEAKINEIARNKK